MGTDRPLEPNCAIKMPANGLLFVGEKGKLLTGYAGGVFELLEDVDVVEGGHTWESGHAKMGG